MATSLASDDMAFLDAQRAKVEAIKVAAAQAEEQAIAVIGLRQRMDQIDAMVNVNSRSVLEPSKYSSEYEGLQSTYSNKEVNGGFASMLNLSPRMQVDSLASTAPLAWSPSAAAGSDPEVEMWNLR